MPVKGKLKPAYRRRRDRASKEADDGTLSSGARNGRNTAFNHDDRAAALRRRAAARLPFDKILFVNVASEWG